MKRLIVLSSIFAALGNEILCESFADKAKRDASNAGYDFPPYNQHARLAPMYQNLQGQGLSYFKEPSFQHDATRQSPHVLQYHPAATQASFPLSNSHLNQQYQTISHQATQPAPVSEQAVIANNGQAHYVVSPQQLGFHQMPVFNQRPVYFGHQPQNQYNVKQASIHQPAGQTGLPSSAYNKEHNTAQYSNSAVGRFFQQNIKPAVFQSINPVPQISTKQQLVHSQVYHPLYTSVNAQQQTEQNHDEKPEMAPPTPPRIYKNFHPMIPNTVPMPSTEASIKQQEHNENSSSKQDEENAEEDEQTQVEQDEDHDTYKEEDDSDDEEFFRPAKYNFASKFKHEDDDHDCYRHFDDDDDGYKGHSQRYLENKPEYSKLFSKHKYPNNQEGSTRYKTKEHAKPVDEYKSYTTGSDFQKPNMEYKVYQYSRSSKKPRSKDNIEGKESEIIPTVHATKNLYEEKWLITKTSSTMH
ncbi:hypothetical protein CBL_00835 [Carabus blaptoides fortunei]